MSMPSKAKDEEMTAGQKQECKSLNKHAKTSLLGGSLWEGTRAKQKAAQILQRFLKKKRDQRSRQSTFPGLIPCASMPRAVKERICQKKEKLAGMWCSHISTM